MTEQMTQASRLRLWIAALVAGAAGVAALWTLMIFGPQVRVHMSGFGFVCFAVIGGGVAGGLMGPYLGQSGRWGVLMSLGAFLVATVIGAFVAGLFGLSLHRIVDQVMLWLVMHLLTPLALLWAALWIAVHLAARSLRRRII